MRKNNPSQSKPSRALISACRFIARAVSRLFWRIEFLNTENIPAPESGGFIIAANHQTYMDPVWISIPFSHDIRYLAWNEAFSIPILGRFIRSVGAMPVNLEKGTLSSLKLSLRILKSGSVLMIFPEGERGFSDGAVHPFKSGAVHLAMKTGVPILPVTIEGGNLVWPRDYRFPRFRKVKIHFHQPVMIDRNIDDETVKLSSESLRVKIGNPLNVQTAKASG